MIISACTDHYFHRYVFVEHIKSTSSDLLYPFLLGFELKFLAQTQLFLSLFDFLSVLFSTVIFLEPFFSHDLYNGQKICMYDIIKNNENIDFGLIMFKCLIILRR